MLITIGNPQCNSYARTKTSNRNQHYAWKFPQVSWHPQKVVITRARLKQTASKLLLFPAPRQTQSSRKDRAQREEDRVMFFVYASSSNEKLPKLSFRARTKFCKRTKKEKKRGRKNLFSFRNVLFF